MTSTSRRDGAAQRSRRRGHQAWCDVGALVALVALVASVLAVGACGVGSAGSRVGNDAAADANNDSSASPDGLTTRSEASPPAPPDTPAGAVDAFREAGYQRGLALCRCAAPKLPEPMLSACARDETGYGSTVFSEAGRRCMVELATVSEEFRLHLLCLTELLDRRRDCEASSCPSLANPACGKESCPPIAEHLQLQWWTCGEAHYCGDVRVDGARCNFHVDCPDLSDERGCSPTGILCDDRIQVVFPGQLCDGRMDCANGEDEQSCAPRPANEPHLVCADGSTVPSAVACDGRKDCADGRDERSCLFP